MRRPLNILLLQVKKRKICTAVGMAVASIAHYDWPEEWPELLPHLLKLINDQTNINGVHGALRCLAFLSGDLDDTVVPTLVPVLFPCLHTIVSSPQIYGKNLRAKALSIVYSCTSILGTMSGVYKTETGALLNPMIPTWMDQFSKILEHPVQPEDPDDWCIRMEVLKCLNQNFQHFPSLADMQFMLLRDHYGRRLYHRLKYMSDRQLKAQMTSMKGDMILMVQSKILSHLLSRCLSFC